MTIAMTTTNSHSLKKYHTFYQRETIKRTIVVLKKLKISFHTTSDELSIKVTKFSNEIVNKIESYVYSDQYFLAKPQINVNNCIKISTKLDLNHENHFFCSILKIAKSHQNPVQFLIDHLHLWTFRAHKVIDFLTTPNNIIKPGVMDTVEKVIKDKKSNFKTLEKVIKALGRNLNHLNLNKKARSLLIYMAQFDGYPYRIYVDLREIAMKELKPLIDNPKIKMIFKAIARNDQRIAFRFTASNYLEKIDHLVPLLQREIIKRIMTSFDFFNLKPENAINLDYFLWHQSTYTSLVLQEIGESELTQSMINRLANISDWGTPINFNKTVICSILKFIGLHTKNQDLFRKIVNSFVLLIKEEEHRTDEPVDIMLAQLKLNQSVVFPEDAILFAKDNLPDYKKNPNSPFYHLHRESKCEWLNQERVFSISKIIQSKNENPTLRILAIRDCAKYFYPQNEFKWVQKEFKTYTKYLIPIVEKISQEESKIGKEAERLLLTGLRHSKIKS